MDRQVPQMTDRGEAGAEVIDDPAHSQCGQLLDRGGHLRLQVEQGCLGDLEVQTLRCHARLRQPFPHPFHQAALAEGIRVEVGADAQAGGQLGQGRDTPGQHQQVDLPGQAGAAGDREKGVGLLQRVIGPSPAHQGLVAMQLAVAERHEWHEPGFQRAVLQGAAQLLLQHQLPSGVDRQVRIGEGEAIAPLAGGLSHGEGGIAQQFIRGHAPRGGECRRRLVGRRLRGGRRSDRHTDAHRGLDGVAGMGDRALDGQAQPFGDDARLLRRLQLIEQHDEGVAGAPGGQLGLLQGLHQPFGDAGEQPVAGPVGEGMVHRGETVDADAQHGRDPLAIAPHQGRADAAEHGGAAGQAGERIGMQGPVETAAHLHLGLDAAPAAEPAVPLPAPVADRARQQAHPAV